MEREISWVRDARKQFEKFPTAVQDRMLDALDIAAFGRKADIAKSMKGLGSGVYEIALAYRSDAYRVIYAVKIETDMWVVHAFQKKSKEGVKTTKQDIDLVKARLKKLKELMR